MNIVIAGGGTGGHVFPAVAVARELTRHMPGTRITFIGTARGIEARIIPKEGFDIKFIKSEGLVGKSILKTIGAALRIPWSILDAYRILKGIRPELVCGVGGYSSGPVVLCAKVMGIPTIILEQNTLPGLTNKILSRFVDSIAVTYHESIKYFPQEKTCLTGNPVREEILHGERERGCNTFSLERDRFTIFVFGGSLGARRINSAVAESLVHLNPLKDKVQFLHQTGDKDSEEMKKTYHAHGFKGTVLPFTHEMADAYAVADLIISRAGATTLSEITACGKAAVLVPYPYAAGNHQETNARKLWDIGAAQLILDKDLNGKTLAEMIRYLIEDPEAISEMERTCKSLGSTDATKKIVGIMMGLLKKKGSNGVIDYRLSVKSHNEL